MKKGYHLTIYDVGQAHKVLHARCRACGHSKLFYTSELMYPATWTLGQLSKAMCCTKCGRYGPDITHGQGKLF